MQSARLNHLQRFYSILANLSLKIGGSRFLSSCSGRMNWPSRGVYFFQEPGEVRTDSGIGPRIVRIGTHALSSNSRTKLWTRLLQHKGQRSTGGGNHRGSIFRLLVGSALIAKHQRDFPTWGQGNTANRSVREAESALEAEVSHTIGAMPFLWLGILDAPGQSSLRGLIERNSIALLSNFDKPSIDPPTATWLGRYCDRERVRKSGLWNSNHVDEQYDPAFLDLLDEVVTRMEP
jgi:hypothetical protein